MVRDKDFERCLKELKDLKKSVMSCDLDMADVWGLIGKIIKKYEKPNN